MRICIITPYLTLFYSQNEYQLAKHLAKKGHKVDVYTSDVRMKKFGLQGKERGVQKVDGFRVHYVKSITDALENPFMLNLGIKEDYDIIHAHEDFQWMTYLAYKHAKKSRTPLVITEERYYLPRRLKKAYLIYNKIISGKVRDYASIITTHSTDCKKFLEKLGADPKKVIYLQGGDDADKFRPRNSNFREELGIKNNELLILTVSRLHLNKGLEYLIKAVNELKNTKLVIIGKGPLEEELKKIAGKNILFYQKQIPNEKMSKFYNACDIYCQPSIKEPFGVAVLEAMSCAKTVIGTSTGGLKDIITKKTGILIKPGSSSEIKKAINKLSNKKLRINIGKRARKRVLEKFDWNKLVDEYENIYKRVIKSKEQ